jgi:4-hydroxybenzoate polyprenyltransferase
LKLQNIPLALTDWQYLLLVLSTVLIAAAGYVINNIFDQDTDLENKPNRVVIGKSITESAAYNIYAVLNISGVVIGFYLSNVIVKPSLLLFYFDSRNIHLRYQFKANDTARKCYYRYYSLLVL